MSPPFALPRTVPLFSAVTPATLAVPLTAARFRLLEIVPLFFAVMPAVPLPPRSAALGGAALDRPGVERRQNGALVAADDLAGNGEVLDRAAIRGEQRRSPRLIFAVEVCDAVARHRPARPRSSRSRRPVAVVEVDVLRQDAFDGAVGLDRRRRTISASPPSRSGRRHPSAWGWKFLCRPSRSDRALGPVGILRLGRSRILPFEDGIAAVLLLCIGLELIAKFFRRQRSQFVRRLALGRAVLDGTTVEIADRLQPMPAHSTLFSVFWPLDHSKCPATLPALFASDSVLVYEFVSVPERKLPSRPPATPFVLVAVTAPVL